MGRSWRKLVAWLVAAAVAALPLSACGDSGDTGRTAAEGTAGDGTFAGVTIEYASCFTEGETHFKWLSEMARQWEEETGGTVKLSGVGRDVLTQIKTRMLTGDAPDIIDQDASELQAALLTNEVLLTPLDDVLAMTAPGDTDSIADSLSDAYRMYTQPDGHDYFIPYIYITSGFFYDKALFADLSLTPPATWEDFIGVCGTLAENGIPPLALDGSISFYNAYYFTYASQRINGAGAFLETARDTTGAAWDAPGFLQAAELVYGLSKGGENYFQPGYEGSAYPAAQADWAMGKAGMVFCGTWIPSETHAQASPDFQYGFFPFPSIPGGSGTAAEMEAMSMGFVVPKDAKSPEAAKDFIRFCSSKQAADLFVETTDNMSPRLDSIYPAFLADVKPHVDGAAGFFKNYDGVMAEEPEWWANVFYPADNALVFGTLTPAEFIEKIKADTIAFYENKQ